MDLVACLAKIRANIVTAESQLAILRGLESTVLKSITKVRCRKCAVEQSIGDIMYIQTHYSEFGMDYYDTGEGQWDCPECGTYNRLYDRQDVMALRSLFAGLHECYCTQDRSVTSDPAPCPACKSVGRTRDGGGWRKQHHE